MDTTDRILRELERMINEGEFLSKPQLENEIRCLIDKVRANEENLINFRNAVSEDMFGSDLIEALAKANQRQYKKAKLTLKEKENN